MLFHPESWKNSLSFILNQPFDATEAHLEMAPYRKIGFEPSQNPVNSAVGIHFFFNQEPRLILIERPQTMRKHAGQIAFPGGKKDEEDKDLIETALRESYEEIGINPGNLNPIGSLSVVYIPVSNYLVHSFVFTHNEKPDLLINPDEVSQIVEVKLSELLKSESKSVSDIELQNGIKIKNAPCFSIQNKIIWGATSILLNELKHRIIQFHLPVV
ncbi:MAG: NUDIX hydrolase [Bacteroidota bacterium]